MQEANQEQSQLTPSTKRFSSRSIGECTSSSISQGGNRVGIYVDYKDIYESLRTKYQTRLDYGKLIEYVSGFGEIATKEAFGVWFEKPLDRFELMLKGHGFNVQSWEIGKGKFSGSVSSMALASSVTRDVCTGKIDRVFLVVAHSKYLPVVEMCNLEGVEVCVFGSLVSKLYEGCKVLEIPRSLTLGGH